MIPGKACTLVDDSKVGALMVMIPRKESALVGHSKVGMKEWVIIPMCDLINGLYKIG